MEYIGKENLEILEQMAPRYNTFLAKRFRKVLYQFGASKSTEILDFGAGIGSLAIEMRKLGLSNIHCLEIDQGMLKIMHSRKLTVFSDIDSLPIKYSYVYMSNVLEHIEDDVSLLKELGEKVLDSFGTLVIYVPAFPVLFSKMDEQVGHFRRYKISSLEAVVTAAGYKVQQREYVDSLGFFSLLMLKLLLGPRLELSSNKRLVAIYDWLIFPMSRGIDRLGFRLWFGKNLFMVVQNNR